MKPQVQSTVNASPTRDFNEWANTVFGRTRYDITIHTDDPKEVARIAKANDMASFIFELVNNGWRKFKHTDYDYEPAWRVISDLMQEYGIDIDELIE